MPKVIVREIDNTKAVGATYSNFTVVIPGPVAEDHLDKFDSVDDENHVYECSSISDFEEYIGKVASEEEEPAKEAEAPEVDAYDVGTPSEDILVWVRSGWKFATAEKNENQKPVGRLVNENYIYTYISDSDIQNLSNDTYWKDSTDGTGKVTNIAIYCIRDEGHDAEAKKPATTGNRLAYLLVGLGYTLLYKSTTPLKSAATESTEYKIESEDFWSPLVDKSNYDFRYICFGDYKNMRAVNEALKVAARWNEAKQKDWPIADGTQDREKDQGRGDVTVLVDVDETSFTAKTQSAAITAIQGWIENNVAKFKTDAGLDIGKYAAICAPHVGITLQTDAVFDGKKDEGSVEVMIPASIYYLACAAKASETYAEWYPVAGYQRGVSDWTVTSTSLPLGDLAIQKLQPRVAWTKESKNCRSVNIVTRIRTLNNQYYLWGSRTAHLLDDKGLVASHFLNIRQLCTTLKKDIYNACKKLTFAPNDELLWIDFKDLIRPTLEKMKSDRGIKDYDIKRVTVSAKALMKAKIRIIPIEPVEDFNIGVYLEDSINGVIADVESEA